MKYLYVDSSVIVAIMFEELAAPRARIILDKATELVSANLLESEVYSAANREGRSLETAAQFIRSISLFFPDRLLSHEHDLIFTKGYARGADAYHIACALFLDPDRRDLHFATLDRDQFLIVKKLGIPFVNLL